MTDQEDIHARVRHHLPSGIICVDGIGFWMPDEIDVVLDRLVELVRLAHLRHERARVMVDLGDNGAQMGGTVERLQQRSEKIYRPTDRLAIVVRSSLLKMQVSRVGRAAECRTFVSVAEAEAWLTSPIS